MKNFDRQYRLVAGVPGRPGFEVGGTSPPLHVSFAIEKTDGEEPDMGKVTLWNLSPDQLNTLDQKDCTVTLRAGYGSSIPLAFSGAVTHISTSRDSADTMTEVEIADGRVQLRDAYASVSYAGVINGKRIVEDTAGQMGVAVTFSDRAAFMDFPNGFSFVGAAKNLLSKVCNSNGLSWSLQNGVLQVRRPNEPITSRAFLISAETGLIGIPKRITLAAENADGSACIGWEAESLMNCAISVNDFVRLESAVVSGDFRVYRMSIDGDNLEGDWMCIFQLMEVS